MPKHIPTKVPLSGGDSGLLPNSLPLSAASLVTQLRAAATLSGQHWTGAESEVDKQ